MPKHTKKYQIKCAECGTAATMASPRAKYCSKTCNQRAYEKRKGLTKPAFIGDVTTPRQKPNQMQRLRYKKPVVANFIQEQKTETKTDLEKLKHQRDLLLGQFQREVNKIPSDWYRNWGAGIGAVMGAKEIKGNDTMMATGTKIAMSSLIYGLIGKHVVAQFFKEQDERKRHVKLAMIKANLDSINEQITGVELQQRQVNQFQKEQLNELLNAAPPVNIERTSTYSAINATELTKIKRTHYKLDGQFKYFLGDEIEQGFSALIHGTPKAGKSHFSVQFAEYLRSKHGDVAYFAAEEGTAKTFENKTQRWKAKFPIVYNILGTDGIEDYIKNHKPKFIFIDSVSRLSLGYNQLKFLVDEYPNISWFFIAQSTKSETYRGSKEMEHLVDTVIKVSEGIAHQKGRTTEGAKTEFKVFPV